MKLSNIVGHGLKTEDTTILSIWENEEAESFETIVSDNIDHLAYNQRENILYMNDNYIPLSAKPPSSSDRKYELAQGNEHTYYYNS